MLSLGVVLDAVAWERTLSHLPIKSRAQLQAYVAEADFFNIVLSSDMESLTKGALVVEVGSGIGLLALQTADRGLAVTAYEPQAAGFSKMLSYREIVIASWVGDPPKVEWRDTYLDTQTVLPKESLAEFAFAINVVEHAQDIESLIVATMHSLAPGGRFRFICPNYAFPYEPHFELPTLFHKALTFRVFQSLIRRSALEDPIALWGELSWPNVWRLSRMLRNLGFRFDFSRSAAEFYLQRVSNDESFAARKGPVVRALLRIGSTLTPVILAATPTALLPVIDCTVYRDE